MWGRRERVGVEYVHGCESSLKESYFVDCIYNPSPLGPPPRGIARTAEDVSTYPAAPER